MRSGTSVTRNTRQVPSGRDGDDGNRSRSIRFAAKAGAGYDGKSAVSTTREGGAPRRASFAERGNKKATETVVCVCARVGGWAEMKTETRKPKNSPVRTRRACRSAVRHTNPPGRRASAAVSVQSENITAYLYYYFENESLFRRLVRSTRTRATRYFSAPKQMHRRVVSRTPRACVQ